jgi:hypothetical protein
MKRLKNWENNIGPQIRWPKHKINFPPRSGLEAHTEYFLNRHLPAYSKISY